jgi:hypothetical protein
LKPVDAKGTRRRSASVPKRHSRSSTFKEHLRAENGFLGTLALLLLQTGGPNGAHVCQRSEINGALEEPRSRPQPAPSLEPALAFFSFLSVPDIPPTLSKVNQVGRGIANSFDELCDALLSTISKSLTRAHRSTGDINEIGVGTENHDQRIEFQECGHLWGCCCCHWSALASSTTVWVVAIARCGPEPAPGPVPAAAPTPWPAPAPTRVLVLASKPSAAVNTGPVANG